MVPCVFGPSQSFPWGKSSMFSGILLQYFHDSLRNLMSASHPLSSQNWKHKKHRFSLPKNFWKNLGLLVLVLGAAGTLALFVVFAYVSHDLPDPNTLTKRVIKQSTKIYDRTGEHLLREISGDETRTLVKIQEGFCKDDATISVDPTGIPLKALQATIAAEDRNFCHHFGFSIKGLLRAVVYGGSRGGGSTLTQQLVKNAILSNEQTLTRKLKELILSVEMERRYSKDEILQIYFNEIPYGSTYYGIQAAAINFYGKPVNDLTLAETATIAAIPQLPTFYINNPDRLKIRRDWILDGMVEMEFISKEEATIAKEEDTPLKNASERKGLIQAPHFVFYIKSLLEEKYGARLVEEGGLRVITSLDYDLQKLAEESVKKGVEERGKIHKFNNAALVAADPKTGQILAMVGSKDYFGQPEPTGCVPGKNCTFEPNTNVATRPRQPGSSFKPIVYAKALELGYTPNTIFWDVNISFPSATGPYAPKDYDLKERGPLRMRDALQGSLNLPAVQLLYMVGIERALDFAQTLGYTTLNDRSRFGLSVVLGSGEVKLVEHTLAFAALDNDGIWQGAQPILKVTDPDGNVLQEWQPTDGTRVMQSNTSRMITNILSDNAARTYVFGPNSPLQLGEIPAAAKSGTTNKNYDAWTMGYVPSLVTGVWVGNNDNTQMGSKADGSVVAAPIWNAFMKGALSGKPIQPFIAPEIPRTGKPVIDGEMPGLRVTLDRATGLLATEYTPPSMREERLYAEYHSLLHYVDPADPLGPPPTNPAQDSQYQAWEAAIADWIHREEERTGIKVSTQQPPTEYDSVHTPANRPTVFLSSPSANSVLNSRTIDLAASAGAARGVSRIEFSIDDRLLGSDTTYPYTLSAQLPSSIGRGIHTIQATAYDDVDNAGTTTVTIQVMTDSQSGTFDISDPRRDQLIERNTPTYTVTITAEKPQDIRSATLYAQKAGSVTRVQVGTQTSITSPFIQFTWTLPEDGDWTLTATGISTSGETLETEGTRVHISGGSLASPTSAPFPLSPFTR